MSQVQPGGDRSGQRPGSPPRKGAPPKRPAAKAAPKGRQNGSAPKGRPPGGAKGGRPPTSGAKGARQNTTISARPPRRFSPSTMAFGSIALVVVIVVVFVVIKVAGGSSKPSSTQDSLPAPVVASAALVSSVTGVPDSVINAVGIGGSSVNAPSTLSNQPPLTSGGKPEVLFIGAEFCPLCAAERWAMVQAFSRFGTWTGLQTTTSSPWDSDPATATFTFRDAKFTSQYFTFVPVEHETNDNHGAGTRAPFQPLTKAQTNLWSTYSSKFGISPGFPFVDFGNKVFVLANSYDPGVLQSLTQEEIAKKLSNPADPVTQGIVGTANYLTAAVCKLTGNQPASVCSATAVKSAESAFKAG